MTSEMRPPSMHLYGYSTIETGYTDAGKNYIGLAFTLLDDKGNEIARSAEITRWLDVPDNYPKMHRLRLLMEAMCRYRNTGGPKFDDLWPVDVTMAEMVLAIESLPELKWPDGWKLWSTEPGEHYLVTDAPGDKTYLRVIEGEFTELLTESQFMEIQTGRRVIDLND